MTDGNGKVLAGRKYRIAARMLWMSFVITVGILAAAAWTVAKTGEVSAMEAAFNALMILWPAVMSGIGLWFGISNAAVHKFQNG